MRVTTTFISATRVTPRSVDLLDNICQSGLKYTREQALDGARFKLVAQLLPKFIIAGGLIPLAGTHFQFIREIPILAKYEVRITLGAWDEKWVCFCSICMPSSYFLKLVTLSEGIHCMSVCFQRQ